MRARAQAGWDVAGGGLRCGVTGMDKRARRAGGYRGRDRRGTLG